MTRRRWLEISGAALAATAAGGWAQAGRSRYALPKGVTPDIGCWFWRPGEFEPGGYRGFIDMMAEHSPFRLLTTSVRAPGTEVTGPAVRRQITEAAEYARSRGIGIVMDLDVRLAREAFRADYPDELQEMLRLREAEPGAELRVESTDLSDHYTFQTTHYIPLAGRLERAFSYVRTAEGIDWDTVVDVTADCGIVEASADAVAVRLPQAGGGRTICAAVAFTHLAADVFAPHLLEFQRRIIESYADAPLAGVCKDEWGFPPCFELPPPTNDFWFSQHMAESYAQATGGSDLVESALLMSAPVAETDAHRERLAAINAFTGLCYERNVEIERDFHETTLSAFGPEAVSATHPTWFPYPGPREMKKNSLSWWAAPRSFAQTDEVTPYCCRTALSKKWGAPWVNMYYSSDRVDYDGEIWRSALGGGRVNYHPVYPTDLAWPESTASLLRGDLMRGQCRVRLLNWISDAPLDCPVAVVFGHAAAMNWAGDAYGGAAESLAALLWTMGVPADLVPTSEIGREGLHIGRDGHVRYGPQAYEAIVLFEPQFEGLETAMFVSRAARRGRTLVLSIGDWTLDAAARAFDGDAILHVTERFDSAAACAERVAQRSPERRLRADSLELWGFRLAVPPRAGMVKLLDGTHVCAAGANSPAGDPIRDTLHMGGVEVRVDAVGIVAARFDDAGRVLALAAGGLRRFTTPSLDLRLAEPVDLAVRLDGPEPWGLLQGWDGPVPEPLKALVRRWDRVDIPPPYEG